MKQARLKVVNIGSLSWVYTIFRHFDISTLYVLENILHPHKVIVDSVMLSNSVKQNVAKMLKGKTMWHFSFFPPVTR